MAYHQRLLFRPLDYNLVKVHANGVLNKRHVSRATNVALRQFRHIHRLHRLRRSSAQNLCNQRNLRTASSDKFGCHRILFMTNNNPQITRTLILAVFLLLLVQLGGYAQTPPAIETGTFKLHKFEQPIGQESYTVTRDGDSLVVESKFEFTDRGQKVPLSATLRTNQSLTPQSFSIKGSISRVSTIDDNVEVKGKTASVREGKDTREAAAPEQF